MICKGCGEKTKLIKAHIIPESIFRFTRADSNTLKMYNTDGDEPVKKAPIGIYDKQILCQQCENRFKEIDDYASRVLLQKEPEELLENGVVVAYKLEDVDIKKLKLFFISVLWRASLSSVKFYQKVKLSKFEEKAKNIIWGGELDEDDFTFVLSKYEGELSRTILSPARTRLDDINYYVLYLGKYMAHVKVDSRPAGELWSNFTKKELIILGRGDIMKSKELEIMKKGVKNTNDYIQKLKSGR